jgi:hypothetical protein
MAWTPEFANAELARMTKERDDRSSRGRIRSRSRDDDFDTGRDSRNSDDDYYQKLLRDIERRIRTGQPANKREVDLLIERGLLELPEDYVLEGNRYVRMLMPEIRTKEQEEMGVTPSMAPGGGIAFGSGFRGALTGDEAMALLPQRPTGPTPEQISLVERARGRIASLKHYLDPAQVEWSLGGAERANLELERMASLREASRPKPKSKAERNFEKWAEANPAAAKELETRISQEKRLSKQAESKEERAKQAVELRRQISEAIKSGKYDPEVVAILNELKSESYKEGTDVETIFIQAQSLFESATKERSRELQEQLDKEERSAGEWDRRQDRERKDRIAAEERAEKRRSVADENKTSYALQDEIGEINDEIANEMAEINRLERDIKSFKEGAEGFTREEMIRAKQSREIRVYGLRAELQSKQSRLATMPGFGGTDRTGGDRGRYASEQELAAAFMRGEITEQEADAYAASMGW